MDFLLGIEVIHGETILRRLAAQQVLLGGRQVACAGHSHQSQHLYAPLKEPTANSNAWRSGGGFVQMQS